MYDFRKRPARRWRTPYGVTRAVDLEHALSILRHQQILENRVARKKANGISLRQELGWSKNRAQLLKDRGQITLAGGMTSKKRFAGKPKAATDPFKTLSVEKKKEQALAWYDNGRGFFKPGEIAIRLGVPVTTIKEWIGM